MSGGTTEGGLSGEEPALEEHSGGERESSTAAAEEVARSDSPPCTAIFSVHTTVMARTSRLGWNFRSHLIYV